MLSRQETDKGQLLSDCRYHTLLTQSTYEETRKSKCLWPITMRWLRHPCFIDSLLHQHSTPHPGKPHNSRPESMPYFNHQRTSFHALIHSKTLAGNVIYVDNASQSK